MQIKLILFKYAFTSRFQCLVFRYFAFKFCSPSCNQIFHYTIRNQIMKEYAFIFIDLFPELISEIIK